MTRKSFMRGAWVIAAGLMIVAGHPASAAPSAESADQASEASQPLKLVKSGNSVVKKVRHSRKAKLAAHRAARPKAVASRKTAAERAASADAPMPPAVADARAEMAQADARGAAEITAPVKTPPLEIAASDQKNELDRALNAAPDDASPRSIRTQLVVDDQHQQSLPVIVPDNAAQPPAAKAPERATSPASATAASGDAWAQSSLIGKIFIALGGMLTLASAARMLIA